MAFAFSNFQRFDTPMEYQGMKFHTVENFYMAMKTKDIDTRKGISLLTPSQAKKAGKNLTLREDWEDIKLRVMRMALDHKFKAGTSHAAKLALTKGEIVEVNTWHDNYWGRCVCYTEDKPKYGFRMACKVGGPGLNMLGKMLMEIRKDLPHPAPCGDCGCSPGTEFFGPGYPLICFPCLNERQDDLHGDLRLYDW